MKVGSLFAGYGGLDLAVQSVWPDAHLAWYSDVCKFDKDGNAGHYDPHRGPCRILAHRFPGVPNLGDVTKVDWAQVEPVDILTGGSPCQDLSTAGARKGMTEGTRSNLWVAMREAIAQLRPSLVIWENVRGAYSAKADSNLGWCDRCLVRHERGGKTLPALRALGRVLGDLSDLGYDAQWHGLRAADVGAPHGRMRVFLAAQPGGVRRGAWWPAGPGEAEGGRASADVAGRGDAPLTVLPTPTTRDWKDHTIRREPHRPDDVDTLARALTVTLLPTPAVNDMGAAYTPETWDAWTDRMKAEHGNGNGHGKSLEIEAQRLIPTPSVADSAGGHERRGGARGEELLLKGMAKEGHLDRWGEYGPAIRRWESLFRPAPEPTEVGPKGSPRLAAKFSEWMMGLLDGWVTDVPDITRNEALKALGNGVVPQQAAAALRTMLAANEAAA